MNPLVRAALVGAASGARTFTGLAAVALTSPRASLVQPEKTLGNPWIKGLISVAATGELVGDQLPQAPSRWSIPGTGGRVVAAAGSGAALAQREPGGSARMPAATGVAVLVTLLGSYYGPKFRAAAADRFGNDHVGAVVEDVYAITAAYLAAR